MALFLLLLRLLGFAPGLRRLHRHSRRSPYCREGKGRAGERRRKNAKPMRASPPSDALLFFSLSTQKGVRGSSAVCSLSRSAHSRFDRSRFEAVSFFSTESTMPPQQRPPPPPNARAVDAEASAGLRTLALQFEATGKWAQVREAAEKKRFQSCSTSASSLSLTFLSFSLLTVLFYLSFLPLSVTKKTGRQVLRRLPRHRRRRAAR